MLNRKIATLALVAVSTVTLSAGAMAETPWQKAHPRRVEVNSRLSRQDRRIHQEVKEGDISHAQAVTLHRKDRKIRHEERAMARGHDGHITRPEQHALNQQENAVSAQIGK